METLYAVSTTFPTVIYTVLLVVLIIYWLIGLLGIVNLDLDGDIDFDLESESDLPAMSGLLLTFGLTGIPLSIVLSFLVLIAWLLSFYTQFYLLTMIPSGVLYYLAGAVSTVAVFFVALPIVGMIIKPFKGLFKASNAVTSQGLIGKEAVIATSTVSDTFCQARIFNEGAELLVDVRADSVHHLKNGDKVLVIEYQADSHTYVVAPYPS